MPKSIPVTRPHFGNKLHTLLSAHPGKVALAAVLLATLRICAVYPEYLHTADEPSHIACGMEWLERGVYRFEAQHPPLARVAAAIGPRIAGARLWDRGVFYMEGAAILYDGKFEEGRYQQLLTLARAGILPFFWLASATIFFWGRRWLGPAEAAMASILLSLTPPVLAHAGLATTDMALTAGFAAALFAVLYWLERPGWRSTMVLGAALAIATLSKFSILVFFPAVVACFLVMLAGTGNRLSLPWRWLGPGALIAVVLIWSGYRFSFGPGPWGFAMPAPELFYGIQEVANHNRQGHPAYLLGERSQTGWAHYYLVVLALKTPIPLLIAAAAGAFFAWRLRTPAALMPLAWIAGVLGVATFSSINIGARHVLPVYLAFALLGAIALARMLNGKYHWAAAALLMVLAGGGLMAHPDYLPYMNFLAGSEPEKYLADSDLDWGQDMKRLSRRLRELQAPSVAFAPFIVAHLERVHGFPVITPSDPLEPSPGWNAVSITVWKSVRFGLNEKYPELTLWPDRFKPTERIGHGTLLYYFPPSMFRSRAPYPTHPASPTSSGNVSGPTSSSPPE